MLLFAVPNEGIASTNPPMESRLNDGSFSICKDDDGDAIKKIDLLLLLDNSTSLSAKRDGKNPTDPEGRRFTALGNMLTAIGGTAERNELSVRFGVISFSKEAREVIPLARNEYVTASSASRISDEVRTKLPDDSQQGGTNYINALNAAFDVFDSSSGVGTCRVLVWMTDGEFSHGSGTKQTNELLEQLPSLTCGPSGWANKVRMPTSKVYPFVVVLSPPTPSSNGAVSNALRLSYELMIQLTGDPDAPDVFGDAAASSACPTLSSRSQMGQIYDPTSADELAAYFEDIGYQTAGGRILACPLKPEDLNSEGYVSIALPAPRFLSWISMVSLDGGRLPNRKEMSVLDSIGGSSSIEQHFDVEKGSASLLISPRDATTLSEGWQLKVSGVNMTGFCIRAKLIQDALLRVERKGGESVSVSWTEEFKMLTQADADRVQLYLSGQPIERKELLSLSALNAVDVVGTLAVDPSGMLAPDGLPVGIVGIAAEPSFDDLSCGEFVIPGDQSGRGDTPDSRQFLSSDCLVDLRNVDSEIRVDVSAALSDVRKVEGCEQISMVPVINGSEQSKFSGNSVFAVALKLRFDANELKCLIPASRGVTVELVTVQIKSESVATSSRTVPMRIDIEVYAPPCYTCVWLLTVATVFVAALLSLGLLWLMNLVLIRLPDPKKFWLVETPINIDVSNESRPSFTLGDIRFGEWSVGASDLRQIGGDRTKWTSGSFTLERRVPNPVLRPLEEPVAILAGKSSVGSSVFYGPIYSERGLRLPFVRAVILRMEIPKTAGSHLVGRLFCLVSTDRNSGGLEAARVLMRAEVLHPMIAGLVRSEKMKVSADEAKNVARTMELSEGRQSGNETKGMGPVVDSDGERKPSERGKIPPPPPSA